MNESVEVANVSSALGGGAVFESELLVPLYVLIFVLAVVGNSLVVATLARNKRMRTVTNVYLLNLAISDLLLGVFCMPFTLVGQMLRNFIFGSVMCKLIPYFQAVSVSVAVWTLVAISLERYFAICRPLKSRRWQTQCHAYKVMGVVWILSLAASVPVLLASQLQAMRQPGRHKCREMWGSAAVERTYSLFVDVVLLLVPLLVMALAYSLVVSKLWRGLRREMLSNNKVSTGDERPKQSRDFLWHAVRRSQKPLPSAAPVEDQAINIIDYRSGLRTSACTAHPKCRMSSRMAEGDESTPSYTFRRQAIRSNYALKSIEAKRKVIRMLFVVVAEFFICWAPLHVLNTWYVFSPSAVYAHVGRTGVSLVQLLAYVSCCCHPITYCFMNRKFRAAFIGVFAPCNVNRCSCCYHNTTSSPRLSPPCAVTPKSEGSVTLADIPDDSQGGIYRHRNANSAENQ